MTTAYDTIALGYDKALNGDQWMRRALWRRYRIHFHSGQRVLDIGCGTGIDAVYLARRGLLVDGFDSSPVMLDVAKQRVARNHVQDKVRVWNDLIEGFSAEGPYYGAISAFAALNTVPDLSAFSRKLASLLVPGGKAVLHMMNRYSLWEWLGGMQHGRIVTLPAVRSFRIGDTDLTHTISTATVTYRSAFAAEFRMLRASGYGSLRPPHTVRRIPGPVVKALEKLETPLRTLPPLRDLGRFFVLELERR